jgi:hypothetical protein
MPDARERRIDPRAVVFDQLEMSGMTRRARHDRGLRLACLTGLLLLAAAGATCETADANRTWKTLVRNVARFESDSERYVAWQVQPASPIVVLDTLTGQRRDTAGCTLSQPQGLYLRGLPAGHGRFIVECISGKDLLNAPTGSLQPLPDVGVGFSGPEWGAVGARYVEGEGSPSHCTQDRAERLGHAPCISLYEVATGRVSYRPQSQPADLDRPGAPLVCPALRKRAVAATASNPAQYSGELLAESGAALRIWRCHGHPVTIRDAYRGEPHRDLDIRGGLVSWDSGHYAPACQEGCSPAVRKGALSAYSLVTGHRWTLTPPTQRICGFFRPCLRGIFGGSAHTRNMLFWIATSTVIGDTFGLHVATSTVYAVKL